jgi:tetratricopeptide (TPR) repeat protein
MAPEQVTGGVVDHRTDIYALGLILYEMATGDSPFVADSLVDLMYQRVHASPRDPRTSAPDLPPFFSRVVLRCLARDPADRYTSAAEVLAGLEQHEPNRPRVGPFIRRISLRRAAAVAAAVLLLAGALAAVPAMRGRLARPPAVSTAPTKTPRVAVLPFTAIGGTPDAQPIAIGIAQALNTKLSALPEVSVSAVPAQPMRPDTPLAQVGQHLAADVLISGTVQQTASGVRIAITADQTMPARRIWASEFSGLPADILTIEDHVFTALLAGLDLKPATQSLTRTIGHPTENIPAYQLYLRAGNSMTAQQDPKNVLAAIDLYEQAIKLDPSFARAYAGMSDSAMRMYRFTREQKWIDKALSAAEQAQHLDDTLVDAKLSLASVYTATGRLTEAVATLADAAAVRPSAGVLTRLGRAYMDSGRTDDAIAAYKQSIEKDPYSWIGYAALGNVYMRAGRYDEALVALKKVTELDPANATGYNDLGAAYIQLGRYSDAAATLTKSLDLLPSAATYTNLAIVNAYQGDFSAAVSAFEKSAELAPNREQYVGNLADGYRWAGRLDKANETYTRAIELALHDLQVNPRDATARANLGMYFAKTGDAARARKTIADARAINPADVNLIYADATVAALGGRTDDALAALEQAVRGGYPVTAAQHDPDLRNITQTDRFRRLLPPPR